MSIEDAEDQLMKIFHRNGTELVKDAPHFDPVVSVRIASIPGRHQQAIRLITVLVQFRGVVVAIPQHEAHLCGNFAQQSRSRLAIGNIGGSQHGGDGKPDGRHDGNHMPFPAIDESTANPVSSNGLRGPWRCGAARLSRGASDARRLPWPVGWYYQWPLHVRSWSRAGSGRADTDPDSQFAQATCQGWLSSVVPRCGELGNVRAH